MDKQTLVGYALWAILIGVNVGLFMYWREKITSYFGGYYKHFLITWVIASIFNLIFTPMVSGILNSLAYSLPVAIIFSFVSYSVMYARKINA